MTRRRACALAILTVVLAGCGSSSSSSSSGMSPAAYRSSVDKLCAAGNAKITALPANTATTVSGLNQVLASATSTLAQIKAITPPSSISGAVNKWLAVVDQSASNDTLLVSAVKSNDQSQVQALAAKGTTLNSQGNAQAKALGLPNCAADAQPSGS